MAQVPQRSSFWMATNSLRRDTSRVCSLRAEFRTTASQIEAALGAGRWAANAALQAAMEDPDAGESAAVSRPTLLASKALCCAHVCGRQRERLLA